MKFILEIQCDNAAFEYPGLCDEVIRILRSAVTKLEGGREGGWLQDVNGNTVGTFEFTEE